MQVEGRPVRGFGELVRPEQRLAAQPQSLRPGRPGRARPAGEALVRLGRPLRFTQPDGCLDQVGNRPGGADMVPVRPGGERVQPVGGRRRAAPAEVQQCERPVRPRLPGGGRGRTGDQRRRSQLRAPLAVPRKGRQTGQQ